MTPHSPTERQRVGIVGVLPDNLKLPDMLDVSDPLEEELDFLLAPSSYETSGENSPQVVFYDLVDTSMSISCPSVGASETIVVSNPSELQEALHKFAGMTWPSDVRTGNIVVKAPLGVGDFIALTSVIKKLPLMFPEATLSCLAPKSICSLLEDSTIFETAYDRTSPSPPFDLVIDLSSAGRTRKAPRPHICVAMGASPSDSFIEIGEVRASKINKDIQDFADGTKVVGVYPYEGTKGVVMLRKEPPVELVEDVVSRCHSEGWKVVELGPPAPFNYPMRSINGTQDFRYSHILDFVASLKAVDCVITIDCMAHHACAAIGQENCVVLWGGSSELSMFGYPSQTNLLSNSEFKCLRSCGTRLDDASQCCGGPLASENFCMSQFNPDLVVAEVRKCLKP
jgi:ADP-heptose:LPS heptosyltransferase